MIFNKLESLLSAALGLQIMPMKIIICTLNFTGNWNDQNDQSNIETF